MTDLQDLLCRIEAALLIERLTVLSGLSAPVEE